jgi:exopolysaccharide production protein ExoZ
MKRLELIQVMRGVAATMVLFSHIDDVFDQVFGAPYLDDLFRTGFAGVDLFFVTTGFLMFSLNAKDFGHGDRAATFVWKRFIRIFPLYWIVLFSKLGASFAFDYDPQTKELGASEIARGVFLLPSPEGFITPGLIGVSWTLTLEIFFYLLFSAACLLPMQATRVLAAAWFTVCAVRQVSGFAPSNVWLDIVTQPLNLEFGLGCLVAYLFAKGHLPSPRWLLLAGAGLFAAALLYQHQAKSNEEFRAVTLGVAGAVLIAGMVKWESQRSVKVPRLFTLLGDASYSVYLLHGFFAKNLTKQFANRFPGIADSEVGLAALGVGVIAATLALSVIVHFAVEKPLIRFTKPRRKSAPPPPSSSERPSIYRTYPSLYPPPERSSRLLIG